MSTDELPTVAEIMNTRVDTLLPDEPLEEAVNLLVRRGYSGAPVVSEDGKVVGVLSEHDGIKALTESIYGDWPRGAVKDRMTTDIDCVPSGMDVIAAANRFTEGKHRRLLVVDEGKLVGMITRRDILRGLETVREAKERGARRPTTYELIQSRR